MNPTFRNFIAKEMKRKIPHVRTLRRTIGKLYKERVTTIRRFLMNKDLFFVIDETPDCESRNVINLLSGALDGKKPIALIAVRFATKVNDVIIREVILEACKKIWKKENTYPRLKVVISDQASYMISALKKMKEEGVVLPKVNHITCVVHVINLYCKSIQEQYFLKYY